MRERRAGAMPDVRPPTNPSTIPTLEQLDVTSLRSAGNMRVELRGELDLATVPLAESALREAEAAGPDPLVIDLSGLRFMDSTGLRMLVAADRRARAAGRDLRIVRGQVAVSRVLQVTGLDAKLNLVDEA